MLMLLFASAMAEEPILPTLEVTPKTLTGTGTVRVNINVVNVSDSNTPISVTLYDPAENVVSDFGSGGTVTLEQGRSKSYSGSWTVTQAQLDSGRITYSVRYSAPNDEGTVVSVKRPFSESIKYSAAVPELHIVRNRPEGSVVEGQVITLSYRIENTGNVDVTDISISDPGLTKTPVTHPGLKVGESADLSYSFTAGTSSITTAAEISYKYVVQNSTKTETETYEAYVIPVTVPNLTVRLESANMLINPGDKAELVCTITNKSDLSYEQLRVSEPSQGDIETNLSLGPSQSKEIRKSVTVNETTSFKFTVSGVDSTNQAVAFDSNTLTIQTTDNLQSVDSITSQSVPVSLDILVEGDRTIIYETPSPIVFRFKVTNNGAAAVEDITIRAVNKEVKRIDKLEPGETLDFAMELLASMGGTYQFTAEAKDGNGETQVFTSNEFRVPYQELATPTPPPTEAPPEDVGGDDPAQPEEPTPTVLTPADTGNEGTRSTGQVLLYILAGLLVVILLAVLLLFILDRRRGGTPPTSGGSRSGGNVVIDSIQRSPHRDYARAPKRQPAQKPPKQQKQAEKAPEAARPTEPAYDAMKDTEMPPMRIHNVERTPRPAPVEEAADRDSIFRRPESVRQAGETERKPAPDQEPGVSKAPKEKPAVSMENTEVYNKEYLTRIRQAVPAQDAKEDGASTEGGAGALSEEEATLLSGSTGQYRLSRRTASVRSKQPEVKKPLSAEDPEAYARRQRMAKSSKPDLSNFYEDDDDDLPEPKIRRRRQ